MTSLLFATAVQCLALVAYHEARSDGAAGMIAAAYVARKRAESGDPRWPSDVCDVVRQGGERRRGKCQFSWYCDGRSDTPRDLYSWSRALAAAEGVLSGRLADPAPEALCFNRATDPLPSYARGDVVVVGSHSFYSC